MFGCSAGLLPGAEVNGPEGGVRETVGAGVPLCGLHVCQGMLQGPSKYPTESICLPLLFSLSLSLLYAQSLFLHPRFLFLTLKNQALISYVTLHTLLE